MSEVCGENFNCVDVQASKGDGNKELSTDVSYCFATNARDILGKNTEDATSHQSEK